MRNLVERKKFDQISVLGKTGTIDHCSSVMILWISCPQALEAVERALDACAPRSEVAELTSKFYTCIPHDFGRRTPPPLDDKEKLQKKFDMLMVSNVLSTCM